MPLIMHPVRFTVLGPRTSATLPDNSKVEAVVNPCAEAGQKASDTGRSRSVVSRGRPMIMSPLETLQARLTPQSWNMAIDL